MRLRSIRPAEVILPITFSENEIAVAFVPLASRLDVELAVHVHLLPLCVCPISFRRGAEVQQGAIHFPVAPRH